MRAEDRKEAFRQGYVRAMYKAMDAVHTALRRRFDPAEIEAMLRRMADEVEVEADGFSAFNEPEPPA